MTKAFAAVGRCILKENQQVNQQAKCQEYPQLLWLLRDFQSKPPEGQTMEGYLEEKIFSEDEFQAGLELKKMFPKMSFSTLPHPVKTDYEKLMSNTTFMERFLELKHQLLRSAKPIRGYQPETPVDGQLLVSLIRKYVQAINEGKYPKLEVSWAACTQHCLDALASEMANDFSQKIQKEIEANLPMEVGLPVVLKDNVNPSEKCTDFDTTLMGYYIRIFSPIHSEYLKKIDGLLPGLDDAQRKQQVHKLQSKVATFEFTDEQQATKVVGGKLLTFINRNSTESKSKCEEVFNDLYSELKKKVMSNATYTLDQFQHDSKEAIEKFNQRSVGPAKSQTLVKFQSHIETLEFTVKLSERQNKMQKCLSDLENERTERENERQKREWQANEERNQIPGRVEMLRACNVTDDSVKLAWRPLENAQQMQYEYKIGIKTTDIPEWDQRCETAEVTISHLELNTTYEFHVCAVNKKKGIHGKYSDALSVTTKDLDPPQPKNLHVIGYDRSRIKIRWDRYSDDNKTAKAVVGFVVQYKKSGSDADHLELDPNIPSNKYDALVERLSSNCEYLIKVGARNSSGTISFTDHITATTKVGRLVRGVMMVAVAIPTVGFGARALYKKRMSGDLSRE